jgi:transcriptional regulator with XRE-family HTH domain
MMQPARLTEIRRALQLSQEAMARLLGVSFATVNRWEGGHSAPTGLAAEVYRALDVCVRSGLKAGDVLGTTPMESGRQLQRIFNLAYGGR